MDFRDNGRVIVRDTGFMYLLPHPVLRNWISNYTITFPVPGMMSDEYSVLPHGSSTLIFSCSDSSISGNLMGPITKPVTVGNAANLLKMLFIVEFQPAGYYAFSGMPQNELTDTHTPFCDVNSCLEKLIEQQLETASGIGDLISEIDRLFIAHLKTALYKPEFILASQHILDSGGKTTVKELSGQVFYSERHLNRMFDRYLGVNVKSFSRLVRVNHALRLLKRRGLSFQQVCIEAGFYDIPHFIHDFKSICGITPQKYRENMSDFYSEIAKF